ncbi:MAG: hypothetical protein ACKOJB_01660 [Chthoniobacterales bacterium]
MQHLRQAGSTRRSYLPSAGPRCEMLAAMTLAAIFAAALSPFVAAAEEHSSSGTRVWPQAWRAWSEDTSRETRKERNHWSEFRQKEKERLLGIERAKTARVIAAVRVRTAAYSAFDKQKKGTPMDDEASPAGQTTFIPQPDGWPPAAEALSRAADTATSQLENAAATATKATQSLMKSIEESLPAAVLPPASTARTIIALLVIFLLPAFAITLLALGEIKVRHGRRFWPRD